MKFQDWLPHCYRASWVSPGNDLTEREAILCATLDRLVQHNNAIDRRAGLPHCTELQHAMRVINEIAGSRLYQPEQAAS
jgi:hypothetical protein